MALQCRYAAQGCPGQLRGRAKAVSRRAVERAARPSEEIRQPRVVELPLRLCVGLKFGESIRHRAVGLSANGLMTRSKTRCGMICFGCRINIFLPRCVPRSLCGGDQRGGALDS